METKKLTAKDLMIGDWVLKQCLIPNKKVAVRIVRLDEADDLCKYEPIALTTEVLEKNGFKYNDSPIVLGWEQYRLTLYRGGDGFLINCGQNVALIINYVHELQHALRLCGINDKEIVL